jgi:hypothetical protein
MTSSPVFHAYDPSDFGYAGPAVGDRAPWNPEEWIAPGHTTAVSPPATGENEIAVFDRAAAAWSVQPDFRRTVAYDASGARVTVDAIGPVPSEWTVTPPPDESGDYVLIDGGWQVDVTLRRVRLSALVNAERARRLAAGFNYDFADARGVHRIGTTTEDLRGWDEVTKLAAAMIATGDDGGTITILTDTGSAEVTAAEWQAVQLAAGAEGQPIWQASFALLAMEPIPDDYATNAAYWPPG